MRPEAVWAYVDEKPAAELVEAPVIERHFIFETAGKVVSTGSTTEDFDRREQTLPGIRKPCALGPGRVAGRSLNDDLPTASIAKA
jgi:hypothetical protein